MEQERSLPIRGTENYYVTNYGRVYLELSEDLINVKIGFNKQGYPQVYIRILGRGTTKSVHRLVAETFLPNDNPMLEVNHIDGDKTNNYVGNLEWVTSSENRRHAYRTGLHGPSQGGVKRVPVMVLETGTIYESLRACARDLGLEQRSISSFLRGRVTHVQGYHFVLVDLEANN